MSLPHTFPTLALTKTSQLLTKDLSLAVSMSSICPSAEIDELTVCLLIVFEQRGRTFELLEALIKEEIEQTGRHLMHMRNR